MKSFLLLIFAAALGGCATVPNDPNYAGGWMSPNGVPMDPTYPGPGAHVGIGVGSWGGRTGGGIGFGLGF